MRSVGLVSFPMVNAGVFFIEVFFLGRLVEAFNLGSTSSSNCGSEDELRSSTADAACSGGSCLRFFGGIVALASGLFGGGLLFLGCLRLGRRFFS